MSFTGRSEIKKVTVSTLKKMKEEGEKISMLTAYDFTMAKILDNAGIDVFLVGDSLGNVICGYETTIPVKIEDIIFCASSVVRGAKRSLVIADMPFGTYQGNKYEAYKNAVDIMQKTGVSGIKMEGGKEIEESIKIIVNSGIPVMGHLGLTPQSINRFGGYGLRAKETKEAEKLLTDAKILEELGCFSIVLEKIPSNLAKKVSESVSIPVIGIGAGKYVDGQVLVTQDMLGMIDDFSPKFVRKYTNLFNIIGESVREYVKDVRCENFPNENESY